ncbi:MAG TPA: hypothetical protein VGO13_11190 [Solirubrobacterales bacterium]|nr:hypothetical protein [Solirubrobacterales bacterium]
MRAAAPRLALALVCSFAIAALVGGCGGGSGSTGSTTTPAASAESRPAPPKSEFPSPEGRTLREVLKAADAPSELVVSPAAMAFYKGENRYPFGVFERDRTQVSDAEVALYFAKAPTPKQDAKSKSGNKGPAAKAEERALDEPAVGPFPASIETLVTQPAFRAQTTSEDPDAASVVYSTQIDFPSNGEWRIAALVKEDGEIKGTLLPSAVVGEFGGIPRPGQKAPKIHTPTAADVGGDLSKITTRIPPDTQNKVDYADALGKEPIVLLFATPQFCQSRVCGPVVDVAEQTKEEYGDEAAFIHMEIYNDNDPSKGVRPQVRAFSLPGEPYLFTINSKGVVSSVIEGAFGLEALDAAVKKVIAE